MKRIIGRKPGSSAPFAQRIRRHGAVSYDSGAEIRIRETFQHSLQEVEAFFDELQAGKVVSIETLESVSTEMLLKTADDIDLFVATGLQPGSSDYPHGHCLQTSMLAMATRSDSSARESRRSEFKQTVKVNHS